MDKFLFGPYRSELGYEILVIRPLVLAGIKRIKSLNKNNEITVCSISNRKPLYETCDNFIGLGSWENNINVLDTSKICDEKKYIKVNASEEKANECSYKIPTLKKEWVEIAEQVSKENYITISARYGTKECARTFLSWNIIVESLRSKNYTVICTSPNNGPDKLKALYLEDLIGKQNEESMGIEMCLHAKAKIGITTNTGAAGIMLLSNSEKVIIFGGTSGFTTGWDGLHRILSANKEYKTKIVIPSPRLTDYNSLDHTIEKQDKIADYISRITIEEIG